MEIDALVNGECRFSLMQWNFSLWWVETPLCSKNMSLLSIENIALGNVKSSSSKRKKELKIKGKCRSALRKMQLCSVTNVSFLNGKSRSSKWQRKCRSFYQSDWSRESRAQVIIGDEKTQIQFGLYGQTFTVLCWLKKADAQSGTSNPGKIKMIRSLRMPLFGMEDSDFCKTVILRNHEEFWRTVQTQAFDEIDCFDESNCQPLKMAFFESLKAILR